MKRIEWSDLCESDQWEAVLDSWKIPYRGNNVDLLLDQLAEQNKRRLAFLEDAFRIKALHCNVMNIIQSSGAGKSRLVHETAKRVFTIPMNLRVGGTSGYPLSDEALHEFFARSQADYMRTILEYLHFFHCLFDQILVVILKSQGTEHPILDALSWHTWLEKLASEAGSKYQYYALETVTNRVVLYDNVIDAHNKSFDQLYEYRVWHKEDDTLFRKVENATERTGDSLAALIHVLSAFRKLRPISYTDLADYKKKEEEEKSREESLPQILMYFDSVDDIKDPVGSSYQSSGRFTNFGALTDVVYRLKRHSLAAICVSSSITSQSLALPLGTSKRSLKFKHSELPPPFTLLPWDILKAPIEYGTVSLARVVQLEHLVQYGRPVWTTTYEASTRKKLHNTIIPFAMGKLCKLGRLPSLDSRSSWGYNSIKEQWLRCETDLIILDVRLGGLPFAPFSIVSERQGRHIRNHQRSFISLSEAEEEEDAFKSGYPSEPVLATAAVRYMRQVAQNRERHQMFDHLLYHLKNGTIAIGAETTTTKGQSLIGMIARFLVILAYDDAALLYRDDSAAWWEETPIVPTSHVSVKEYLEALLQGGASEGFWSRLPDEVKETTLGSHSALNEAGSADADESEAQPESSDQTQTQTASVAFENARIFFTHLVPYEGDDLDLSRLYEGVLRGQAFYRSYPSPESSDTEPQSRSGVCTEIVIPIIFGDPDENLVRENISGIFIQVRYRATRVEAEVEAGIETNTASSPPVVGTIKENFITNGRPYISIEMQLGEDEDAGVTFPSRSNDVKLPVWTSESTTPTDQTLPTSSSSPSTTMTTAETEADNPNSTPQSLPKVKPKPNSNPTPYSMTIKGCSNQIFKVIQSAEDGKILREIYRGAASSAHTYGGKSVLGVEVLEIVEDEDEEEEDAEEEDAEYDDEEGGEEE